MRIDAGGGESGVLWLDLTPSEAAELRDALNSWDGEAHMEAEWHIHVVDGDGRMLSLTVGNSSPSAR